jgi:AmiR/NasT family two-component response regulator
MTAATEAPDVLTRMSGLYARAAEAQANARAAVLAAQEAQARQEAVAARMIARQEQSDQSWQQFLERLSAAERRGVLSRSPYARLMARIATMPPIEQAKGMLMAQQGCTEDEAFDLLRRASQRANVPVRELAIRIIAGARSGSASRQATG